jgi:hypothetical protein
MPHAINLCLEFMKAKKGRDAGLMPDEAWPSSDPASRGMQRVACRCLHSSLAVMHRRRGDA